MYKVDSLRRVHHDKYPFAKLSVAFIALRVWKLTSLHVLPREQPAFQEGITALPL